MIAPWADGEPILDLSFPLTGLGLPADHGYPLYAALSAAEPELHRRVGYGVHPVAGQPCATCPWLPRSTAGSGAPTSTSPSPATRPGSPRRGGGWPSTSTSAGWRRAGSTPCLATR
jgi:hypothetical protein